MSAHEESAKTAPEGRDASGRFTQGNAGGPGNPFARQVASFRGLLLKSLTDDDLIAIALIERAKQGNVAAAKLLLLQYTLGKPIENPHPDRLDADELATYKANTAPRNVLDYIESVPLEPALELMRLTIPGFGDHFRQEFRDQFVACYGEDGHGGSFAQEQASVNERKNGRQPEPKDDATRPEQRAANGRLS